MFLALPWQLYVNLHLVVGHRVCEWPFRISDDWAILDMDPVRGTQWFFFGILTYYHCGIKWWLCVDSTYSKNLRAKNVHMNEWSWDLELCERSSSGNWLIDSWFSYSKRSPFSFFCYIQLVIVIIMVLIIIVSIIMTLITLTSSPLSSMKGSIPFLERNLHLWSTFWGDIHHYDDYQMIIRW